MPLTELENFGLDFRDFAPGGTKDGSRPAFAVNVLCVKQTPGSNKNSKKSQFA
jgi:hypothetical protein